MKPVESDFTRLFVTASILIKSSVISVAIFIPRIRKNYGIFQLIEVNMKNI